MRYPISSVVRWFDILRFKHPNKLPFIRYYQEAGLLGRLESRALTAAWERRY